MNREQRILSLAAIVHGAARRYPGDKDDLTQAAWVGAIHAVDTWDEQTSSLHGYAWQCCNWAIGKHLRKTNGVRADRKAAPLTFVSFDQAIPNESCDNAARIAAVDRNLEAVHDKIDAERILEQQTPHDRAVLVLLSEYRPCELARAMNTNHMTISRLVKRVRAAA